MINGDLGPANYPGSDDHWVIYNGGPGSTVLAWTFGANFVLAGNLAKSEWDGDPLFVLPDDFPKGDPNASAEEVTEEGMNPQPIENANTQLVFPKHTTPKQLPIHNEQLLLSVGYGELKFWETQGGRLLKTLPFVLEQQTGFRNTNNLTVSPDGSRAALCEREQVFLFNIDKLELENVFLQGASLVGTGHIFSRQPLPLCGWQTGGGF